jgi:hypothetical protein
MTCVKFEEFRATNREQGEGDAEMLTMAKQKVRKSNDAFYV